MGKLDSRTMGVYFLHSLIGRVALFRVNRICYPDYKQHLFRIIIISAQSDMPICNQKYSFLSHKRKHRVLDYEWDSVKLLNKRNMEWACVNIKLVHIKSLWNKHHNFEWLWVLYCMRKTQLHCEFVSCIMWEKTSTLWLWVLHYVRNHLHCGFGSCIIWGKTYTLWLSVLYCVSKNPSLLYLWVLYDVRQKSIYTVALGLVFCERKKCKYRSLILLHITCDNWNFSDFSWDRRS